MIATVKRRSPRVFPRRIEFAALALPTALLALLVALDFVVLEPVLGRGWSQLVMLGLAAVGVVAFSVVILDRFAELQLVEREQRQRASELAEDLERRRRQLQALNEAGLSLSAELDSSAVLQKIVDLARAVAAARYAALGIFDENGEVTRFLTSGITAEERARIGPLPRGRGLLGLLQDEQRPIRVAEMAQHPASVGFPPHHPPMRSFLGVPILWRGTSVGNLYLTEKVGAKEFSEEDEAALMTLAAQAAIAIENARLYEQVGRISVLEERHRIGMDLHDGAMQSLYGVGLMIEDVGERLAASPDAAQEQLGRAIDRLNSTIQDLRGYVVGLRPIHGSDRPLSESLPTLASQVGAHALLEIEVDVDPRVDAELDLPRREALFYIAADALGNVARHSGARSVRLAARREDDQVVLSVDDDGVGFDATAASAGLGLRNIRERALRLGGELRIETAPGRGTRVRMVLPVGSATR